MKKLSAIAVGYGNRGATYCKYASENPDKLEIVAVAEPHDGKRELAMQKLNIKAENAFSDWKELAQKEKMADFAILATQDEMQEIALSNEKIKALIEDKQLVKVIAIPKKLINIVVK